MGRGAYLSGTLRRVIVASFGPAVSAAARRGAAWSDVPASARRSVGHPVCVLFVTRRSRPTVIVTPPLTGVTICR